METRLESGRVPLRLSGGAPMQQIVPTGVDYVAPRVESRTLDATANILDRMSTSVFGVATNMRQREAAQFSAENEITSKQLELAKNGITEAITGLGKNSGNFTVFGQALKKSRTLQLASHFEIEGKKELATLLTQIQSGEIKSSKDVAVKIKTMTDSFAKPLAQVDGEASLKFRAVMATHGNIVLNAAFEAELKRAKNKEKVKLIAGFDKEMLLLEAAVRHSPSKIDEIADVSRKNLATQALLLGDLDMYEEYSAKFESALRDAKINAVTGYILTDEYLPRDPDLREKIMTAKLNKMSPVMLSLLKTDMRAVAQINANVDIALNRIENVEKDKKAKMRSEQEKIFTAMLVHAYSLTDPAKRKEYAEKFAQIRKDYPDMVPISLIEDMAKPRAEKKDGHSQVEFNVRNQIFKGEITTGDQIWAYTKKGLSILQAISALNLLHSEDKAANRAIELLINRLAGINTSTGASLDPRGAEFDERQELLKILDDIKNERKRDGKPPLTVYETSVKFEALIAERRNTIRAKAARKQLDDIWSKQPWINGPITRENLPILKDKAKGDRNKENAVAQIEKLLNQAEGK